MVPPRWKRSCASTVLRPFCAPLHPAHGGGYLVVVATGDETLSAAALFTLFENHGLLDITHRPQWYVVPGGSREYIRAMLDTLGDRLTLHLNAPVQQVIRHDRGVDIAREGVTDTLIR